MNETCDYSLKPGSEGIRWPFHLFYDDFVIKPAEFQQMWFKCGKMC